MQPKTVFCMPASSFLFLVILLTVFFHSSNSLPAQSDRIEVVPNRPSFSTTAETVWRGVLEIEYGLEGAKGHQNINGLIKFGLTEKIEMRFSHLPAVRERGDAGLGDSGAGLKYRFFKEKRAFPTLSTLYTFTLPTASAELGSEATGHSVGLCVSKNFGKHHLDFNESIQWLGKSGGGFDRNYFTAFAYSHPIKGNFGFSEEIASFSRIGTTTEATLTILQTLTYSISPRFVIDGGCYVAAKGDLPRTTFFLGVTYAIADLYRHRRHP